MARKIGVYVTLCYAGRGYFLVAALTVLLTCCSQKSGQPASSGGVVVEAIEGDVDSFNPLFAQVNTAGEINDLLFPCLMSAKFNASTGSLEYGPLIASSWEFENGNADLRFHLRPGAKWSDGSPLTARDVQASYELYADTVVASVRQNSVNRLKKNSSGVLDVRQAVEVINDSTILFHFDHAYPGARFDADLPVLPAHILEKIARSHLREDSVNMHPLSSGPFKLDSWNPGQEVVLISNPGSTLPNPSKLSKLIFRVVPDYHSRLMQLKSGEVDVFPYINPEDAADVAKNNPQIEIVKLGERFYDAINWNNIDHTVYAKSKGKRIVPHPLFGSANVRRALTTAINRKEIVDSYLQPYGREAIGPVSPLFRWAFNDTIAPLKYDPLEAASLLKQEGWNDADGDGTLEKGGRKFSFVLKIPSGNQLRATIASIVQQQLKAVKIEVKIEQVERAVFWGDLAEKNFDACIAGFDVPLQMQLDIMWGSDLKASPLNIVSFRNRRVDEILAGSNRVENETDHAAAWKEFQEILQREQPCTFLYWMSDLVAVNNRVKGTSMGVLGIANRAGEWYVSSEATHAGMVR